MIYVHKLGVGLIPTEEDRNRIYELVNRIKQKFDLTFATEPNASIPHLTLFQGVYQNESEVVDLADKINVSRFSRHQPVKGLSIWAEKILFLDCERTDDLHQLHRSTFGELFPICQGKSADPQKFVGITSDQQKSFDETGYPFSLREYSPHFTLGHLKDQSLYKNPSTQQSLNDLLQQSPLKNGIGFEKFVVYRVAPLGACKEFAYERML